MRLMIRAILLSLLLNSLFCVTVFAQAESEASSSNKVQVEQNSTVLKDSKPTTPPKSMSSTSIDLNDPALIEALDAREKADRAIAAAIKAQKQALDKQEAQSEETAMAPAFLDPKNLKTQAQKWGNKILEWLTSIPFLAQIGAIIFAYIIAPFLASLLKRRVFLFREAPKKDDKFRVLREYLYRLSSVLRAIILVGLLAGFAFILRLIPLMGQDWLVKLAQSLALILLLYRLIKEFVPNALVQKIALWTVLPIGLLVVFGYFDDFTAALDGTELMNMGGTPITLMTVVLLLIFGGVFFKLGTMINAKGQDAIRAQDAMDATTQEVIAKIFQIVLFALIFVLVLGAAKVPLSGLVVIFSALSLGIGLGLQPIAANFVSGLIVLLDRSVKVGDFVMMEDEKFGRIKAINMRSTTVATADGKDIIVPNTSFTEGAYENWTHDSPLQRYEVDFGVAYDTDLDALVPLIRDAVLTHQDVLDEPDLPSVEFRSFGDSAINMCVEFWCRGIDDGPNKFTSDVGFIIWRTLKANNIEIPFPQRVVKTLK